MKLARTDIPADSYLLKINKGVQTPKHEIWLELTKKAPE